MSEKEVPMRDRWDPFLDAYIAIKEERDEVVSLARDMVPHITKSKKETYRKQLINLLPELKENDNGKS